MAISITDTDTYPVNATQLSNPVDLEVLCCPSKCTLLLEENAIESNRPQTALDLTVPSVRLEINANSILRMGQIATAFNASQPGIPACDAHHSVTSIDRLRQMLGSLGPSIDDDTLDKFLWLERDLARENSREVLDNGNVIDYERMIQLIKKVFFENCYFSHAFTTNIVVMNYVDSIMKPKFRFRTKKEILVV